MQSIKGKSSRKMMSEFKTLSRQFWGRHIWARGYFVASSGNVTDEVIMQYIELQGKEPEDGNFRIDQDRRRTLAGLQPAFQATAFRR